MTEHTQKNQEPSPPVSIGLIEKAWEWKWAVRLAYLVLFLDIALLLRKLPGVLDMSISLERVWANFGYLLTAACSFGLIVSFGIPALAFALRQIFSLIGAALPYGFFEVRPQRYQRPDGYVSLYQLREHAARQNSDFLMRLYEKRSSEIEEAREQREQIGMLFFGMTLLCLLDWSLGRNSSNGSLVQIFMSYTDDKIGVVALVALVAVIGLLRWAWFPAWKTNWAYYPPLHDELVSKERAEKDAREKLRREWNS